MTSSIGNNEFVGDNEQTNDLRPEYDFDFSKAERGRYAKRKGMTLDEAERWLAPVLSY